MIVLSLGAGVQSSTLFLMALHGEFEQMPDAAVFADTQNEPVAVYEWLAELEQISASRIPIYRVSQGNLRNDVLRQVGLKNKTGQGFKGQPPFFVRNSANDNTAARDAGGRLWRDCTADYKIVPLRRETRRLMLAADEKSVTQWIGISLDEAIRMKDSRVKYITNAYPLIDKRMTRQDCVNWLRAHGYPVPPKSSCIICPFHSNAFWRAMKDNDPASWENACDFDERLRHGKLPYVVGDCYLHRSFMPLRQVDFSTIEDKGQIRLLQDFGEECEGLCGT